MISIDIESMKTGLLSESEQFSSFEGNIKKLLGRMFGTNQEEVQIKGDPDDVKRFSTVMKAERQYIQAIHKFGKGSPQVNSSKYELDAAINDFELNTGIPYPLQRGEEE